MNEKVNTSSLSVEALQAGNRDEFARLVDLTSAAVYRLILGIVNIPQDAEDALQETYIKTLRSLPKFEGRSSLTTWLYRIAVNEALMMVRKHHPEVISVEENSNDHEEIDSEGMQIIDWCCMPEEELVTGEARKVLNNAIQRLPQTLKVVFLLRDTEGLSIRDTAQALSVSEEVVKVRLLRARLKLREELSAYYGERMMEKSRNGRA